MVSHCNLRCAYCDQWAPFWERSFVSVEALHRDVERLAESVRLQEFKLLGGEPLLNPALLELIDVVRRSKIAEVVSIVTNGVLLPRLPEAFWRAIDRLWLSLYPGVELQWTLDQVRARAEQHGVELIVQDHIVHPFRLTNINHEIEDAELVDAIYRHCREREYCNTIHQGRFFKCTPAMTFERRMGLLGIDARPHDADSVDLYDTDDLAPDIAAYLASLRPLRACSFCLGSLGKPVPATQASPAELRQRLRQDHRRFRELLNEPLLRRIEPQLAHRVFDLDDVPPQ